MFSLDWSLNFESHAFICSLWLLHKGFLIYFLNKKTEGVTIKICSPWSVQNHVDYVLRLAKYRQDVYRATVKWFFVSPLAWSYRKINCVIQCFLMSWKYLFQTNILFIAFQVMKGIFVITLKICDTILSTFGACFLQHLHKYQRNFKRHFSKSNSKTGTN